jgi:ABC-type dipeptide/oligopeptide/nickel transport system permease subunit
MARSHHRKKHREHVKQFRQSHDTATPTGSNGKAVTIVMIVGALTGLAVAFFASGGVLLWMTLGLIIGAVGGYFAGKRIDEGK